MPRMPSATVRSRQLAPSPNRRSLRGLIASACLLSAIRFLPLIESSSNGCAAMPARTGDVADAARSIADALEEAGIDYAIGGALAYAYYGIPRATNDIDLNVFPSSFAIDVADLERLILVQRDRLDTAYVRHWLDRLLPTDDPRKTDFEAMLERARTVSG